MIVHLNRHSCARAEHLEVFQLMTCDRSGRICSGWIQRYYNESLGGWNNHGTLSFASESVKDGNGVYGYFGSG